MWRVGLVRVGELRYGSFMRMSGFQKVALAALVFVVMLIFVGAIVRVSGAGMGCPDWPKCYGQYIPPMSVEELDTSLLDIDKFKEKAEKHGRDPDAITEESIVAEFNAVHTWTEFINRLFSLPIGIFTMLTFIMSLWWLKKRPAVTIGAFLAVLLVGINAWMGAKIVYSGLRPGTITTHMALAILLMCVQTFVVWAAAEKKWAIKYSSSGNTLRWVAVTAFLFILLEGVMGSQVREVTDALKKSHGNAPRIEWVAELEHTWMYLVHRSFSWVVLLSAIAFYVLSGQKREGGRGWHEHVILGIVLAQMVLGLVLSQVGILAVVQVLHIGLSSILACVFFHWLLGAFNREKTA
ncbi:cytochrome c oxidase assembly protein subunit 15 [Rubritalea squalenifaciens DSM 18772]|uniref:Cytochrome c oxidase assembly protein subunit 15 n=2 Tax=Rubritalea squalenifaciens TaxID=407226 RepID=A0A1M6R0M4_9BACT|nr:cytochrome c oxidase assembly protein subunit 15 [Rubritalea squalenifaciens DSM 18772]